MSINITEANTLKLERTYQPDQLVNLLANYVLFHTMLHHLYFLILIYHNHSNAQRKLITLMIKRETFLND